MILFGHIGMTLAATRLADKTIINRKTIAIIRDIDYRFVILGSLLPDILDKSILLFLSGEKFKTGRLFAHSLLFSLLIFILGIAVWYGYKKSWVFILAACCFIHQMLDEMWKQSNIFFWPFYDFLSSRIHKLLQVWVPGMLKTPVINLFGCI